MIVLKTIIMYIISLMCVYMHACMYRWIYYVLVKTVEQMDQDHTKIVDNIFHGSGWVSMCVGGGQCF